MRSCATISPPLPDSDTEALTLEIKEPEPASEVVEEKPKDPVAVFKEGDIGIQVLFEKKRDEIALMMPSKHAQKVFLTSCDHYGFTKDVKTNIEAMLNAAKGQIRENKEAILKRKQQELEKRRVKRDALKEQEKLLKQERVRKRMLHLMKLY